MQVRDVGDGVVKWKAAAMAVAMAMVLLRCELVAGKRLDTHVKRKS